MELLRSKGLNRPRSYLASAQFACMCLMDPLVIWGKESCGLNSHVFVYNYISHL